MRWIIGDLHGMLRPLETLLEAIGRLDRTPQFIFVGDLVNRGPDSKRSIELIMSLPAARVVRGNHDDIFDLVINGQCYGENASEGDRLRAFHWFMQHGLEQTFLSYGAEAGQLQQAAAYPTHEAVQRFAEMVPERHRQFIRNLPAIIEFSDIFVAHAKWSVKEPSELPGPGAQLETKPSLRHRILWGRYTNAEVSADKPWERVGYFGHTPVTHYLDARDSSDLVPVLGPQIVLVDTASALFVGGRLTAYCAGTKNYVQADRFGRTFERSV